MRVTNARRVLVAVSGSIAAYKSVLLVRELLAREHKVRVMMSPRATEFVGPLTFSALTGEPPVTDMFRADRPGEVHVELAEWAELIVVAPATAHLMARAAQGLADDVLTATLLCTDAPTLFAPAMHTRMWSHPATAANLATLRGRGALIVGPTDGPLASGASGLGRLVEPSEIADAAEAALAPQDLSDRRIIVTAGPTAEDLDPVRFLSNRSSGKMGFAIARAAADRGAEVELISGPCELPTPPGVRRTNVRSAREMHEAVLKSASSADAVVMAAAVADYRPAEPSAHKIKKDEGALSLSLVRNPDILADLGRRRAAGDGPLLVGFALETRQLLDSARRKLEAKGADLIVGNPADIALGGEKNRAILVTSEGHTELPILTKAKLAARIWDEVAKRWRRA